MTADTKMEPKVDVEQPVAESIRVHDPEPNLIRVFLASWPQREEMAKSRIAIGEDGKPKEDHAPFSKDSKPSCTFGGVYFEMDRHRWRKTLAIRDTGEVIGAPAGVAVPRNLTEIARAVSIIMSSKGWVQSGIFVTPRLLLSSLHFSGEEPSKEGCIAAKQKEFLVESEVCGNCFDEQESARVRLVDFDLERHLGIFVLLDRTPSRRYWANIDDIQECTVPEDYQIGQRMADLPKLGDELACIVYNGRISPEDREKMQQDAKRWVKEKVDSNFDIPMPDLGKLINEGNKSVAIGTMDAWEQSLDSAGSLRIRCGVTASLWKGSSGGPCVMTKGPLAGKIIGFVHGSFLHESSNIIEGVPPGLKEKVRGLFSLQ